MIDSGVRDGSANAIAEGDEVVEVVLAWRDATSATVLAVHQVRAGESAALGELGELLVPREVLGKRRFVVATHAGDLATAFVPAGATLRVAGESTEAREVDLVLGRVVEIAIGPFDVRLARVRPEARPALAPLQSLGKSGAGYVAGSAVVHAAVFVAIALYASTSAATEELEDDSDRVALIQHLLDASAMREPEATPAGADVASGADSGGAPAARGLEGASGSPDSVRHDARRANRGTAPPDPLMRAAQQVLDDAAYLGTMGGAAPRFTGAPSPWERSLPGSDPTDASGILFADRIGDAAGSGGLGVFGPEKGGGGTADILGIHGIGGLRDGLGNSHGSCDGPASCAGGSEGYGVGRSPHGAGHVSHFKGPRYAEPVVNGGHLPAEVIQRIVRQNDGRYRLCYELGLRGNPMLSGRVTVKFVIDRSGGVSTVADGGSDIPDADVRSCVVRAFANLSFPAPENGSLFVTYPIVFSPE
jgi:hypothetical protein